MTAPNFEQAPSRRRVMSIWLTCLATDRLRRADHTDKAPSKPLVTVMGERGALRLAAVDERAAALGLAPGLMLTDARALVPGLAVAAADSAADAECLAGLAEWCARYSPWTAVVGRDGLWLDITGCAQLFAGERALIDSVLVRLRRLGFAARAAIADTPGAAWAMAHCGDEDGAVVPPGETATALAALPIAALRLAASAVETLDRLGLRRIGDLPDLPRSELVRRFGPIIAIRLDQAFGRVPEPISPRRPVAPYRVALAFAEPIGRPEDIAAVTTRLLDELGARLAALQLGARRLELTLFRADGALARAAIGTSRPSRDRRSLARLFAEPLQKIDPGFGIEAASLDAAVVEPLLPAQIVLRDLCPGGDASTDEAADLAPLIDRLSNRLGAQAVTSLAARASHIPERATIRRPAGETKAQPWPDTPIRDAWTEAPARPLRLLPHPEPIEAVAPVPDDPPVLFRWRRVLHRVASADGPERLAPEWWRFASRLKEKMPRSSAPDLRAPHMRAIPLPLYPPPARGGGARISRASSQNRASANPQEAMQARDYYRVEAEDGRRFWLYRDGLYRPAMPPRWYLHGLFA